MTMQVKNLTKKKARLCGASLILRKVDDGNVNNTRKSIRAGHILQ